MCLRPYWLLVSAVNQRRTVLHRTQPLVSFTFDDFPRSALVVGGRILEDHQARGTFYAAMGLMNVANEFGVEHFNARDLETLVRRGHELGGHTVNHVSCRKTSLGVFRQEVLAGQVAVQRISNSNSLCNFSYPFGHVTMAGKKVAGAVSRSCRGSLSGINRLTTDLNLLRANRLYGCDGLMPKVKELIAENARCNGWLIFYTHDVSEQPSKVGCTPEFFEATVRCVAKSGAQIVTVAQALTLSSTVQVSGDARQRENNERSLSTTA
jgi:peptidoglycan/xylan/chitin deacetylase (PgdA/CDA1 family)